MKARAPNAAAIKQLEQLCSCTDRKLRSTVRSDDGGDVVSTKLHEAEDACLKQLYPNG